MLNLKELQEGLNNGCYICQSHLNVINNITTPQNIKELAKGNLKRHLESKKHRTEPRKRDFCLYCLERRIKSLNA